MTDTDYEPSPTEWVRNQVETYEASGGTEGTTLRGMPVIIVYATGVKSGKLRKIPLMRVEHGGRYLAVASLGGAPTNPVWYNNVVANPNVELRDGTERGAFRAREIFGDEKAEWWVRAVEAFPDYADYQKNTERTIPVFLLEPVAQLAD